MLWAGENYFGKLNFNEPFLALGKVQHPYLFTVEGDLILYRTNTVSVFLSVEGRGYEVREIG